MKPTLYIFSNSQSLSDLKSLKDEFTRNFSIHEDDVLIFMNLAIPYFKELEFFRGVNCKKYIVHRAAYNRHIQNQKIKGYSFKKYFGLEELDAEKQFFTERLGLHYEYSMDPSIVDLDTNRALNRIDWSFLKKYPDEHTPTTGFIVYFVFRQFFPDHQVKLINFDGKESNMKFGHKWAFEIQYFNNVKYGNKVKIMPGINTVNLCYITDDGYAELTQMSIFSAIYSKSKNTILNIYVICDNMPQDKIKVFEQLSCENVFIKTVSVNGDDFVKYGNQSRHVSKTTYLKIFLPDILKDLDKVLYMDSDTFIRKDLKDYFNQLHIDEKYDMAVIKDLGKLRIWPNETDACKTGKFFYAGQLLMNLKSMRCEDKLTDRFMQLPESLKYQEGQDQDALNLLELDRVKFLDIKYIVSWHKIAMNNHPEVYKNIKLYNSIYGTEYKSINELVEKSVVWHFHGDKKEMAKNQKVKKVFDDVKAALQAFKRNKDLTKTKIPSLFDKKIFLFQHQDNKRTSTSVYRRFIPL